MFLAEKDLVKAFQNSAEDFLSTVLGRHVPNYFLVEEFDSHHGVADLVLGIYKSRPAQKEKSRKTLNWNWIRPLINFEEDLVISIEQFMSIYCVSKRTAHARFREYSEAGFLKKINGGQFRLVRKYEPVTEKIVAIEAKLRNWQRALRQAYRYKRFSHQSYVLLDSYNIQPALKKINEFRELNVGLISLSSEGYKIHHKPITKEVGNTHSFLRLNEAVFDQFSFRWANA